MSQPQIALSTASAAPRTLGAVIDLAAAAGCNGIELVVTPEVLVHSRHSVVRRAGDAGVRIASVHPFPYALPIISGHGAAQALVGLARDIGAAVVTVHPPNALKRSGPPWTTWLRGVEAARDEGRRTGVVVSVENGPAFGPGDRRRVLASVTDLGRFCAELGLGVTYDTSHAWSAGEDVVAAAAEVAQQVANLHLSDVRQPRRLVARRCLDSLLVHHQLPGQGELPLARVLSVLAWSGYEGPITLELSPLALGWRRATVAARLAAAVEWVRENWPSAARYRGGSYSGGGSRSRGGGGSGEDTAGGR